MLPVLLISGGEEIRFGEAVAKLADQLNVSLDERSELLPSGKQTVFGNRTHWAKTYLNKAGLLENTRRGYFRITPAGQKVVDSMPSSIDSRFLMQFEAFRQFKEGSAPEAATGAASAELAFATATETPDEIMRVAHRRIDASLAQDLLDRIRAAPPEFFERLIVNLLHNMGFGGSAAEAGRAIGRSGDDGVDGVIDQDALGLDRVYIQAKRYAAGNNIGAGAIRDFFGSLDRHKASKGLFVTTSTFSSSARETAEFLSKRIVLIDSEQLTRLMIRHDVGCRIEETLHIKKLDEDFFD